MIKSFDHKGLKLFFETGNKKSIIQNHSKKLQILLTSLDLVENVEQIYLFSGCHELKGDLLGRYAIKVTGAWRLHFEFIEGNIHVVDYENYH